MIPTPTSRRRRILACLPDADDALRRLADAIQAPEACRKRVCRAAHRCQGGFGPPCFLADRGRFADAVREEMDEHRAYWAAHRARLEADLRALERPRSSSRSPLSPYPEEMF